MLKEQAVAGVVIDQDSEVVLSLSGIAPELFGELTDGLSWWHLLGSEKREDSPLYPALRSGVYTVVSPSLFTLADGSQRALSATVTPNYGAGRQQLVVTLRVTDNPVIRALSEQLGEGDRFLVLGVDNLVCDRAWSGEDSARLMMEARTSLLEIVRQQDIVSLPVGLCIGIILRRAGDEEARNVASALLSHLRSVPGLFGSLAGGARFCVGMAGMDPGHTVLDVMAAANSALFCAQIDGGAAASVAVAGPDDGKRLAASNAAGLGLFGPWQFSESYFEFLTQLAALDPSHYSEDACAEQCMDLILANPGITEVAIFRKTGSGEFQFSSSRGLMNYGSLDESEDSLLQIDGSGLPGLAKAFQESSCARQLSDMVWAQPLYRYSEVVGALLLSSELAGEQTGCPFVLDACALELLASLVGLAAAWENNVAKPSPEEIPRPTPLDTNIEGYVVDNMEGAVDQASFLARLDLPVAIVGPRGTGKMYIAKIVHQEWGGAPGMVEQIDGREYRNREKALKRINRELEQSEGKTLVFKSPQLMAPEVQLKLARQLSSRRLADANPPRYLPRAKYVALFPAAIDHLLKHGGLTDRLASVFAGYPINVPPIRDRKQAVLRWAHKILSQESADRAIDIKGFTPDAERAMLSHDWEGNISEMRDCIREALARTENEWLTPVDLGIFKGISPEGSAPATEPSPFLAQAQEVAAEDGEYSPSLLEALDVALGEAVNGLLADTDICPLGAWLQDDIVLAAIDRYAGDTRLAAEFLHTRPRNIGRWQPKIEQRESARNASKLWKEPARLLKDWVRESPHLPESPIDLTQYMLMSRLVDQCDNAGVGTGIRAKILAVSVPTYHKRLETFLEQEADRRHATRESDA